MAPPSSKRRASVPVTRGRRARFATRRSALPRRVRPRRRARGSGPKSRATVGARRTTAQRRVDSELGGDSGDGSGFASDAGFGGEGFSPGLRSSVVPALDASAFGASFGCESIEVGVDRARIDTQEQRHRDGGCAGEILARVRRDLALARVAPTPNQQRQPVASLRRRDRPFHRERFRTGERRTGERSDALEHLVALRAIRRCFPTKIELGVCASRRHERRRDQQDGAHHLPSSRREG